MDAETAKRLKNSKRQYILWINDVHVAILVDDDDDTIVAGVFEIDKWTRDGFADDMGTFHADITIKPIKDKAVFGYAVFMMMGIIETVKKEKEKEK